MATLSINGKSFDVDVEPDTPLLWVLRENLGLTGTKYGCGIAQCGACTVHIDGVADALLLRAVRRRRRQDRSPPSKAWPRTACCTRCSRPGSSNDVPQCGYCQSGMIMAVAALLKDKPKPTDADIDEAITNICRCGTFQQVREAIHAAAQRREEAAMNHTLSPQPPRLRDRRRRRRRRLALGLDFPFGRARGASRRRPPEVNAWVVIRPDDTVVDPHRPLGNGPGHAHRPRPAGRRGTRMRLVEGDDRISDARPEPCPQARLGRIVDRRQPRHPHLAGICAQGRRRRAHHADPGRRQ